MRDRMREELTKGLTYFCFDDRHSQNVAYGNPDGSTVEHCPLCDAMGRIRQLEAQLNAAILARREAGKEMRKQIKAARLEGWRAARDQAAKVCAEYAEGSIQGCIERAIGADRCASSIRAMNPPSEWGASCSCGDRYPIGSDGARHIAKEGQCENCQASAPQPWPHEDGFAGGLTERNDDASD